MSFAHSFAFRRVIAPITISITILSHLSLYHCFCVLYFEITTAYWEDGYSRGIQPIFFFNHLASKEFVSEATYLLAPWSAASAEVSRLRRGVCIGPVGASAGVRAGRPCPRLAWDWRGLQFTPCKRRRSAREKGTRAKGCGMEKVKQMKTNPDCAVRIMFGYADAAQPHETPRAVGPEELLLLSLQDRA